MPHAVQLHTMLDPGQIIELKSRTKAEALRELADTLRGDPRISDHEAFVQAIFKREELISTGVGLGFAIPHVKIPEVTDYVIAAGRSRKGIDFDALDGKPVHLIVLIGGSERHARDFVKMLARVMHLMKSESNRSALRLAPLPDGFLEIIRNDDLAG